MAPIVLNSVGVFCALNAAFVAAVSVRAAGDRAALLAASQSCGAILAAGFACLCLARLVG